LLASLLTAKSTGVEIIEIALQLRKVNPEQPYDGLAGTPIPEAMGKDRSLPF
jgi:hypothetical protein